MNRLDYTIRLISRFRTEKSPPVIRYLCLLALAEANGKPMTKIEIFRRVGMAEAHGGTLENAIHKGLVAMVPGKPPTYVLTPEGIEVVSGLLNPPAVDKRKKTRAAKS